jgi:pyruvate dehydrogenase E1 component alpha subunit
MKTYRYRGHSMSDPAKYRTRDEVDAIRSKQDPIENCRRRLHEAGVEEEELKELDKAIKAEVKEAADFALESPEPEASELYTDVLAEA